jgi:hypothetical protein
VFEKVEENLNTIATQQGEISLTVPFVCLDCRRLDPGSVPNG